MSMPMTGTAEYTLYQANPEAAKGMKGMREHLHGVCKQYVNHTVRVETMDGDVFEGILMGADRGVLYLKQPGANAMNRFNPYSDAILALVLFELLVITLLI
ncbi:hypothetical protein [Gorillibacterium sp. sgz500922]|uniref:hypothetical protein n=1 Tax=Gorillibacterium sp. sgz500922 TaxID=3446694 RepID=UPI003F6746BB